MINEKLRQVGNSNNCSHLLVLLISTSRVILQCITARIHMRLAVCLTKENLLHMDDQPQLHKGETQDQVLYMRIMSILI
jgi:hypothetical protein